MNSLFDATSLMRWATQPLIEMNSLPVWPAAAWIIAWLTGLIALHCAAAACGSKRTGAGVTITAGTTGFFLLCFSIVLASEMQALLPAHWSPAMVLTTAVVLASLFFIVPLINVLRTGYGGALCTWVISVSAALIAGTIVTSAMNGFHEGHRRADSADRRARDVDWLIHTID